MTRRDEPITVLSAGLSHLMMAGLILLVALPALQPLRQFQSNSTPQISIQNAPSAPAPVASSTQPPATAAPPVKEEWPQDEIVHAKEQCTHLLSGTPAEFEYLEPIKKGDCGLPAPVRLKSIGSDPKIVFDPPVDVNCRMVAAMGKWVKSTLQPKARDRLQSSVVRIVRASGYSCRNIYNRPNARLSQHALANAIDIGGFVLANGRTISVLKGWGATERDIKAQAKAKAEAAAKAKADRAKGAVAQTQKVNATEPDPARPDKSARPAKSERPDKSGSQVTKASMTPSSQPTPSQKSLSLQKKSIVAAMPATNAVEAPKPPTKDAMFLRAIHGGACHEFGTVMGPEANDPHRNHFHLDLISRRNAGYCE